MAVYRFSSWLGDGAEAFPALCALPSEFQVCEAWHVVCARPVLVCLQHLRPDA